MPFQRHVAVKEGATSELSGLGQISVTNSDFLGSGTFAQRLLWDFDTTKVLTVLALVA
jgi:hypothetical protein